MVLGGSEGGIEITYCTLGNCIVGNGRGIAVLLRYTLESSLPAEIYSASVQRCLCNAIRHSMDCVIYQASVDEIHHPPPSILPSSSPSTSPLP